MVRFSSIFPAIQQWKLLDTVKTEAGGRVLTAAIEGKGKRGKKERVKGKG